MFAKAAIVKTDLSLLPLTSAYFRVKLSGVAIHTGKTQNERSEKFPSYIFWHI
jgi:hypothetical protein